MKAEIWKLRIVERERDEAICSPCLGKENTKHILLRCPEAKCGEKEF
jgi:hypothetical protein